MNTKTEAQIARMKEQTIGVEIEMNGISREKAAKIAADFFGTGRSQNTAFRNGYNTWSAWDSNGREWKFQKDVSIAGPDSEKCELVTPILHYEDIELLQELARKLRRAGAKSDYSIGCGVHIHIGAQGHTPQSLRNLANIMASHETLIAEAIKVDRSRMNRYCRTVDPHFLEQLNHRKPATMAQLADIWYGSRGCDYGRTQHYNNSRQQQIPYAEPPRHLHKRHGRVQNVPVRQACQRQEKRNPRRKIKKLHSALPCNEPDGKGCQDRQPQGTAEGK